VNERFIRSRLTFGSLFFVSTGKERGLNMSGLRFASSAGRKSNSNASHPVGSFWRSPVSLSFRLRFVDAKLACHRRVNVSTIILDDGHDQWSKCGRSKRATRVPVRDILKRGRFDAHGKSCIMLAIPLCNRRW